MQYVILGPTGAGKSTLSRMLAADEDIPHICIGDMLREANDEKTKELISRGVLLDDKIISNLIRDKMDKIDYEEGFVLDGYPRNITQAITLDFMLKEKGINFINVINLTADEEFLRKRILSRKICEKCGRSFGLNQESKDGINCNYCLSPLSKRLDDKEISSLNIRLENYREKTANIFAYYMCKKSVKHFEITEKTDFKILVEEVKSFSSKL